MTGGSYILDHSDPPSGGSIDSTDSGNSSYEAPSRGERANYVRQNAVQSPYPGATGDTHCKSPDVARKSLCNHSGKTPSAGRNCTVHGMPAAFRSPLSNKILEDVVRQKRTIAGANFQPPVPLCGAGYDNLAVGYFMPTFKSAPLGPNCAQHPSRVDACTTMHLDFLASPGESSNSSAGHLLSPSENNSPFYQKTIEYPSTRTFDPADLSPLQDDGLDSLFAVASSDLFGGSNLTSDPITQTLSPTPSDISLILLSPGQRGLTPPNSESSYAEPETNQVKQTGEHHWSRYPVLPPVVNPQYLLVDNGQSEQQIMPPSCGPTLPLFGAAFADSLCSSTFPSARNSTTRSSYSGRGSRNKRALSISPLSAEGIDFNSLIRSSPTSLLPFHHGSISSSSSASGCYGHLSARNSSGSPRSVSITSSQNHPWGVSYTPHSSISTQNPCKEEFVDLDANLLTYQSMQLLEAGQPILAESLPALDNHVVLPQNNLHQLEQELYKPDAQYLLPPPPPPPSALPPIARPPPPSYDQHMARRKLLLCQNSSDSSQPSNYSSFDSSEGCGEGVDGEQGAPYLCRWIDCSHVFLGQEELVRHIEKAHVDQRKGDEFVCFWQGCSRRLLPFNARYKLLVHMRVHSGDKPNKCTFEGCTRAFSRLENLKIHFRSHTGEKPYTCQYTGCTKAFSNSSDRAKHQRTHQDTKPYACQVPGCTKRYTDPSSLRKHVKNHMTKSDQAKKKLRGGLEVDPDLLSECLTIQPLRPVSHCDCASPPEPTDSGLGRSPHGSKPGSSTDHYPGANYCAQNLINQTSPPSHHSSPPLEDSCDVSSRLTLPPIHQSPSRQPPQVFIHKEIITTNQQEVITVTSSATILTGRSLANHRMAKMAPRCQTTSLPPLHDAFSAIYEGNRSHSGGIS